MPLLYSPPIKLNSLAKGIRYLDDPEIDWTLARQEFRTSPLYKNLLTNKNADTTALQVSLQRDEKFFTLLKQRDDLRTKNRLMGLNREERRRLKQAESEFIAYSIIFNQQQRELSVSNQ